MVDEIKALDTATPAVSPTVSEAVPSTAPAAPASIITEPTVLGAEPAKVAEPVAPAEVPAKAVEPAPEPAKSAEPPKTVAEPAKAAEPVKPAEGEKPAEVKKEEVSKSAEPAPLPTYDAFTLPEGVTLDNERIGEFTKALGEFENLTKAGHAEVQKFGQELVNKHVAEVEGTVKRLHQAYQTAWIKQTEDWKQAFINDPEIGGNRQATTVAAANEFIKTHGGTAEQQTEFRKLMQETGIGNHPAMIRIFANAKKSPNYREGQPLAAKPAPVKLSGPQRMYGKKA